MVLMLLMCASNLFGQEKGERYAKFILVSDGTFPDVVSANTRNEAGVCESIKIWVSANKAEYFEILDKPVKVIHATTEKINALSPQSKKEYMLALDKVKVSMQCQRYNVTFYKAEQIDLHQQKVVNEYFYLVSGADFVALKKIFGE
jgi:hypothetical protein